MKKIFLNLAALFTFILFCSPAQAQNQRRLIVFFSPGCHACIRVEKTIMPEIEKKYGDKIIIDQKDITNIENYKFMLNLRSAFKKNSGPAAIPLFYFEGNFMVGAKSVEDLSSFIDASLNKAPVPLPESVVDLYERFKSFRPALIFGAALIDGINPCAFTVIVFFMSFLVLQGYRRRELVAIGLSFIFAVFLTYFLLGLGIFQFLYRLEGFSIVSRIINLGIGAFSIFLGFFALYDFFKFKKTGQSEDMTLQLPKVVKNRIHSVIGEHYRRNQQEGKKNISGLIISAFVTGFLVSLLEAVCTGQTYLPTLVFILKAYKSFKALLYLLAYNLLFIFPLVVVFLLALFGATSKDFSGFMKKHMGLIKILMALLFFALGAFLVWRG